MQRRYWILSGLFMLALLVAGLSPVEAQAQRTVEGVVTEGRTGQPIPGANIRVKNTSIGTTTNVSGEYSIEVPADRDVLVFSFVGYESQEITLRAGQTTVDVTLQEDVVGMEEVVVTGLASGVKRENLANSVETVSAADLVGNTSVETLDGALAGKVTGAQISSYSGAPGGGMSVKLRGVSTINGNSQPLYIVDGVIISNEAIPTNVNAVTAAAAGGNRSNQDNPVNRIADLNPRDIESIEILKGPSAAAIYGGRASNGVVIIETKSGSSGETRVNVSQALGVTTIQKTLGMRQYTAATADSAFGAADTFNAANGNFIDYEDEIFGNQGLLSRSSLSVSGGTEDTRFFVSGLLQDDGGIVERTGYEKRSIRANIQHDFTSDLTFSGTAYYTNNVTRRGLTGNDNSGTTYGIALIATPNFIDIRQNEDGTYPAHPFNASNPLQTIDLITNEERVNRTILSNEISYNVFTSDAQSLRLVGQGGLDVVDYESVGLFPRDLQFERNDPDGTGTSILGQSKIINSNVRLLAVHQYNLNDSGLSFTTQAGVTGANSTFNFNNFVADDLIPGQQNVDQASSLASNQDREFQTDRSFFAQEEINWDDQVIFTTSIRGDRSSLNGDTNEFFFYPRAAMALNLHNFDFWGFDNIDQFKLRGAFGQTGNTAGFGTKFTSFDPSNIGGQAGTLIGTQRGFADVQPERQTEIEAGLDLGVFQRRANLNFTVYQKKITDQILTREVPASSGFVLETFNGGTLINRGLEASLTLIPVDRDNFTWRSRTNFWTNDAEVDELPVPAFRATGGGFGVTLGEIRIEEGQSPSQIIGIDDRLTQYFDESAGEDGEWVTVADVPDGAADVTAGGASIEYRLGDAAPDFEMSFDQQISFLNGFTFSVLAHWRYGNQNLNLSELLYDLSGTSPDYDETTTFTRNVRNPNGTPIVDNFGGDQDFEVVGDCGTTNANDPEDFATCTFQTTRGELRNNLFGASAAQFVQDASFFRIREIGLYYALNPDFLDRLTNGSLRSVRLGVSANNLFTITPYKSYDPEVNNFASQPVATGVEVAPYPSSKQFFFHLDIGL